MKRATFNIKTRGGAERAVSGHIFKFKYFDCEDTFYFGAYRLNNKYIITELESGINLGIWSYYKKDLVYYIGKSLMKHNRFTFLNLLDSKREELINADAIAALLNCKAELYYPATIDEAKRLIMNHWADDTSHVLGVGIRPYYQKYIMK